MNRAARVRSSLRSLLHRGHLESAMDEELRLHLDARTQHLISQGMSPAAAQRQARVELGSLEAQKEDLRASVGLAWVDATRSALRQALRQWRHAPGFAAIAILSMALGIGATTAMYSVIHAVLLNPFPYRDADRIVHYTDMASARMFKEWGKLDAFEDVIVTDVYNMGLSIGNGLPDAVMAGRLSANAFEFFGVPPALGRTFHAADSPEGHPPEHAVVLGHKLWISRFGADAGILGKRVQLDRETYTVIGVAAPRFQWKGCDLFIPADLAFYKGPSIELAGRLKPGATAEQAAAQALASMRRLFPKLPPAFRVQFRNLADRETGAIRGTLFVFLASVFVLLIIACANLSILLLARGASRQHEMAVRAAIGASRRRLLGQVLAETSLLTLMAAALGAVFAQAGLRTILAWLPPATLPREADIRVNVTVLLWSVTTALVIGLLSGLAPALRLSQPRLQPLMQEAARRIAGSLSGKHVQNALLATQVALTLLLLAGAGTAVRALVGLHRTELGYDPAHFVRLTIPSPEGKYDTWESRKAFAQSIVNAAPRVPGVEFAALGPFTAPFFGSNRVVQVDGIADDAERRAVTQEISPQYFDALRIPLLEGRVWSEPESDRAAPVAIINAEFARRYFPNGNAIGQRVRLPSLVRMQWVVTAPHSTDWLEIVGIAANVRNRGPREPLAPALYIPYTLSMGDNLSIVVRSRGPVPVAALRQMIHTVAPGQVVGTVTSGQDILRENGWQREEIISTLFTIFASLALALAAIGLYSTVSYATALRSQELGIRVALGAQARNVIHLVLAPAARTVGAGIVWGIAASLAAGKLLTSWTTAAAFDPWVLPAIVTLFIAVAGLAALAPTIRTLRIDPNQVLRN